MPPGRDLDRCVADLLDGPNGTNGHDSPPPFSTDDGEADRLRSRLEELFGKPVTVGRTRTARFPYFARFESGASTSTEVVAESVPLAVARLALIVSANRRPKNGK